GPELAGPSLPAAGRGISSFGWSADGRTVLVSRPDDGYDLFDAATGQHVRGLPGKADVRPWFGPGSWQTSRLCPMLVSPPELYAPPINPGGHRAGDSQVHTWDRRLLAARGAHDEPLGRGVDARTAESPPSAPTVVSVYEAWTGRWLYRLEPPIHGDMAFSQDGRRLLTIDRNGFRVWDSVTGKELLHRPLPARGRLPTGTGAGAGIAWAPDGRRVAIGDRDGTILIWDVAVPRPKRMPLSPANLDQLWTDLGSDDPHVGWKAVNALADRPGESVEFLLDRVTPVKPLDAKTVQPLIADLDSPSYRTRERATRAALEAGDAIRPAIDAALKAGPGPESRKRLEDLQARLANGHPPTTNDLRRLRAIAVLEAAGSEEARGRIEELALGMPGARVTMEAKLTAERLATRDQSGR
ncbi:MAG TPA: WD40 repeat domain-containing protein, partial [Gemmataceae bacterium]|nr:WD40 repeat domain-containing protein [Gemmataceae bacterium]